MLTDSMIEGRPLIETFLEDPDSVNPEFYFSDPDGYVDPETIRMWLGYSPPLHMIHARPKVANGTPAKRDYLERKLHESIRLMGGDEVTTIARLNALGSELNEFYEVYGDLPPAQFIEQFKMYFTED